MALWCLLRLPGADVLLQKGRVNVVENVLGDHSQDAGAAARNHLQLFLNDDCLPCRRRRGGKTGRQWRTLTLLARLLHRRGNGSRCGRLDTGGRTRCPNTLHVDMNVSAGWRGALFALRPLFGDGNGNGDGLGSGFRLNGFGGLWSCHVLYSFDSGSCEQSGQDSQRNAECKPIMTDSFWPHQTRVIEAVRAAQLRGIKRILVVLPTGGGKSRVGAALSIPGETVAFAHTRELVRQNELSFPGVRVITVQSPQRPPARVVIVDEAHRYASSEWRLVYACYPEALIIGLTATPCRADGKPLDMFEELIVGASYSELVEGGFIVPCDVYYPAKRRVKGLAMNPVDAYIKYGKGRSGFFYANRSEHAEEIAAGLRAVNVRAECIGSHIGNANRATIIAAFLERHIDVLTNVNVLTEGFNAPWASFVGLASPCAHLSTYLQRAGRGARSYPGKTSYVMVDLCGAYFEHGSPVEDRLYSLTGKPIRSSERLGALTNCAACGYCYESGGPCPRCGHRVKVKQNPLLIRSIGLKLAVQHKNTDAGLAEIVKLRGERSWYWVGSEYKKLFGKWPDLRFVSFDQRKKELELLKANAIRIGRKQGYAFILYEKIFGEPT